MEKSSEIRKQAFEALSIHGSKAAVIAVLESFVKEGEAIVLESPPADPKLPEKLIKAQERRFLLEIFRDNIK